jgi:AAA domain
MQNIEYSCDSGEDKGLPRRNGALPSGLPLPAGQTGLVAGAGPEFGNLEDEACAAITEPSFSTWITIKTKDGSFRYWGDPDDEPPWHELEATVPDTHIFQQQSRKHRNRFKPLTLGEIAELPPPEWLIAGLVPEDGLVVLYGEPNVGKSFVALDWALSVAEGVPWLGHDVQQGEVVYIYAEGARGLRRRAAAWLKAHDRTAAPRFRAVPLAVTIPDPGERSEFVKAVRSVSKHPKLIIIDTLARNFGAGNESLAQDMNGFVRGCDELREEFPGATVLVVHHSGKDPNKGARGSLALQGATDAVFALTKSGGGLSLANEKQKDGEEAPPISLRLVQVSLSSEATSCVVQSAKASPNKVREPQGDPRPIETDEGLLKALAGFGPDGARLAQWREAAGRANDTFYKSRNRHIEAGKVRFDEENARYFLVETSGPGPEQVQDVVQLDEIQKVSPEVPP